MLIPCLGFEANRLFCSVAYRFAAAMPHHAGNVGVELHRAVSDNRKGPAELLAGPCFRGGRLR